MLSNAITFRDRVILFAIVTLEGLLVGFPLLIYALNQAENDPVKMALTAAGNFGPNQEFTVLVYVKNPKEGQRVALLLPDGVELVNKKDSLEKELCAVTNGDVTTVSWKVTGTESGVKSIEAELSSAGKTIASANYDVRIRIPGCTFWMD